MAIFRIKLVDAGILVLFSVVTASFAWASYSGRVDGSRVFIKAPSGEWIFPLSTDLEFEGAGPEGTCVISIRDGSASVLRSNCPRNICIQTGAIAQEGQWIACLPHGVFINIEGNGDGIDAVTY
jgi:hypothetical protein